MLFENPDHPGRGVRLGYCLNLHPADDFEGCLEGMRRITLPLAERMGGARLAEGFGVGMWLPAHVANRLAADEGVEDLDRLLEFLAEHRLDPFTFNAFPVGGFHREGLKESVFRPTWKSPERLAYTLAVAEIARATRSAVVTAARERSHVSISTHSGMFAAWLESDAERDECADNMALAALQLCRTHAESDLRIILSIEPEPRSLANDTHALPALFERLKSRAREVLGRGFDSVRDTVEDIVGGYVGTCLDACHAAVEFEVPAEALARATSAGVPLGKLQFSSALALQAPGANRAGRERLLSLAEPVYLHQVTGRRGEKLLRAGDLPELEALLADESEESAGWSECDEWRCHFHVPVDLEGVGDEGLGTTRVHADQVLRESLAAPERWGTDELHVEIETYTWDVLPAEARGSGALVDALEREYRHVTLRLAESGWLPVTR